METLSAIIAGFSAMSVWEYVAVALSMAYLLLAMKESLWCWPAAFISTLIYTLMYWNGALLMESALHFYYMGMAVYGWWAWRYGRQNSARPALLHTLSSVTQVIAATAVVALVAGYIMDNYTHADYAYLDSLTTCFAVVTTYLVAQKCWKTGYIGWLLMPRLSIYMLLKGIIRQRCYLCFTR